LLYTVRFKVRQWEMLIAFNQDRMTFFIRSFKIYLPDYFFVAKLMRIWQCEGGAKHLWLFRQSWNTMYVNWFSISILKCSAFFFSFLKMHKNVNINNKMFSLVFYSVIKAANYDFFFLQCWLLLSPYKTHKKAFYCLNSSPNDMTN
jgi:hypothetical protein